MRRARVSCFIYNYGVYAYRAYVQHNIESTSVAVVCVCVQFVLSTRHTIIGSISFDKEMGASSPRRRRTCTHTAHDIICAPGLCTHHGRRMGERGPLALSHYVHTAQTTQTPRESRRHEQNIDCVPRRCQYVHILCSHARAQALSTSRTYLRVHLCTHTHKRACEQQYVCRRTLETGRAPQVIGN